MNHKERRKKQADLSVTIEELDNAIEIINEFMTFMSDDDVKSQRGQMYIVFSKEKDVQFQSIYPMVDMKHQPPDPEVAPKMSAVQLTFSEPMESDPFFGASFGMDNITMIRAMETIKKDHQSKLEKFETELSDLIKQKKGDQ